MALTKTGMRVDDFVNGLREETICILGLVMSAFNLHLSHNPYAVVTVSAINTVLYCSLCCTVYELFTCYTLLTDVPTPVKVSGVFRDLVAPTIFFLQPLPRVALLQVVSIFNLMSVLLVICGALQAIQSHNCCCCCTPNMPLAEVLKAIRQISAVDDMQRSQ